MADKKQTDPALWTNFPAAPGVKGTFKQAGKTYDGARLFTVQGSSRLTVVCPCGQTMTRDGGGPAEVVYCVNEACPAFSVRYSVKYPTVILQAVADAK